MTDKLDEFRHLWTSERDNYLLIRLSPTAPDDLSGYVIFHRVRRTALIIEDDTTALEVIRRMRDAGVEVATSLPKADEGK